jgi:hypothetical protein
MSINIRKVALVLLAVSLAATLAQLYGMITTMQMVIINVTSSFIMMVIVIVVVYRIHKLTKSGLPIPEFLENTVSIPKFQIENMSLSANSDLLKKSITPTNPFRVCVFRIYMEINNSAEQLNISAIRLIESKIIEDATKIKSALEGMYVIDTVVGPRESINFQFDKDIFIKRLKIEELYRPG